MGKISNIHYKAIVTQTLTVPGYLLCAELPTQRKRGEAVDTLYCIKSILCRTLRAIASNPLLMLIALIGIGRLVA